MDYSKFYQKWLQIEVPQGETPNLYEILGLNDAEPNLRTISAALERTLDHIHQVDGMEQPEVFGFLFRQLLDARHTLLDPKRKHDYDSRLLVSQGKRAWRSYLRPTWKERLRQFCLMSVGLALGICMMMMMAVTANRNPDGSIAFHEDVKVAKSLPFTQPLTDLVYRPEKAHDFREKGYVANIRNWAVDEAEEIASSEAVSSGTSANLAAAPAPKPEKFVEPQKNEREVARTNRTGSSDAGSADASGLLDDLIPESMQSAKEPASADLDVSAERNTSTQMTANTPDGDSGVSADADPFAELLPSGMISDDKEEPTSATEKSVMVQHTTPNAGESPESGNSRSFPEASSESDSDVVSKSLPESDVVSKSLPESDVVSKSLPGFEAAQELTSDSEKVLDSTLDSQFAEDSAAPVEASNEVQSHNTFSPILMLEMLEDVRARLDSSNPESEESFTSLQYHTCLEIAQKSLEESVALPQDFVSKFVPYALEAATNLGWGKHFEESGKLCEALTVLAEKRHFTPELQEVITRQKATISQYQTLYEDSQETYAKLQENPEDPALNTRYAMWLWRETGELKPSIPYLAKCKSSIIRQAANWELQIEQDERYAKPQYLLKLADLWWEVSTRLNDEVQSRIVKEHALSIYEKVDQSMLNEEQQLRISSRADSAKK